MNFYENLRKLSPRIITEPRRHLRFVKSFLRSQGIFFDAAAV